MNDRKGFSDQWLPIECSIDFSIVPKMDRIKGFVQVSFLVRIFALCECWDNLYVHMYVFTSFFQSTICSKKMIFMIFFVFLFTGAGMFHDTRKLIELIWQIFYHLWRKLQQILRTSVTVRRRVPTHMSSTTTTRKCDQWPTPANN